MVKKYIVFNYTDGIIASPPNKTFGKKSDANEFIKEFRARFKKQGYYFTSRMQRISPEHVDLEVVELKQLGEVLRCNH